MYKESWIFKYYNLLVNADDDGNVMFWDSATKEPPGYSRFKIYIYIPELSRPYFYSKEDHKNLIVNPEANIETTILSKIPNALKTQSYPATKSLFYTAPYFFKLKTPSVANANYLQFKGFQRPNFTDCILAMVTFNDESNNFVAEFSPGITLPFKDTLFLNKTLEFILVDAKKQQVLIEDNSYLYFSISIL